MFKKKILKGLTLAPVIIIWLFSGFLFCAELFAREGERSLSTSYPKSEVRPQTGKWSVPDFGPDGLLGLSEPQKRDLQAGKVLLLSSLKTGQSSQTIIQAAVLFQVRPEKVWEIISTPELQAEYLDDIDSINLLEKRPEYSRLEFAVKFLGKKVRYTVVHYFRPEELCLWWELDHRVKNDLKELFGFWRFYPAAGGNTVARYGSLVVPSFPVPGFIKDWLFKNKVEDSLIKVKNYVERGGRAG